MRRMAARGVVLAACFIPALMAADAAQKMRPPLPKPKPAEIAEPETQALSIATPDLSAPEVQSPEPDAGTHEPGKAQSAIVIPREKPAELRKDADVPPDLSEPEPGDDQSHQLKSAIVIPREKPAELRKSGPEAEATPNNGQTTEGEKPEPGEDFETCRKELAQLGAKFKVPDMPAAEQKCTVANPVQITAIGSAVGEVAFPGEPILNCVFAKRFTAWVSDIAAPVVRAETGEMLAAIATGPGFECRGRNGDSSGKISEHALGNAIDIASFKLKSKESMPVANVAKSENVESRWLMALRTSACGYFTTVLGPGANAAHAEHYHFDLGLHGKSGNYKICE